LQANGGLVAVADAPRILRPLSGVMKTQRMNGRKPGVFVAENVV
jgi:hypothetical protein